MKKGFTMPYSLVIIAIVLFISFIFFTLRKNDKNLNNNIAKNESVNIENNTENNKEIKKITKLSPPQIRLIESQTIINTESIKLDKLNAGIVDEKITINNIEKKVDEIKNEFKAEIVKNTKNIEIEAKEKKILDLFIELEKNIDEYKSIISNPSNTTPDKIAELSSDAREIIFFIQKDIYELDQILNTINTENTSGLNQSEIDQYKDNIDDMKDKIDNIVPIVNSIENTIVPIQNVIEQTKIVEEAKQDQINIQNEINNSINTSTEATTTESIESEEIINESEDTGAPKLIDGANKIR